MTTQNPQIHSSKPVWPGIVSARCRLRPAQRADYAALEAAVTDPTFPQALPLAQMYREGKLMRWLEKRCENQTGTELWSISTHASDECIGQIALLPIQSNNHEWWLSYWLAPLHWRKGIAGEAVAKLLSHAFAQPEYKIVVAMVASSNLRSVKLLTALGFAKVAAPDRGISIPEHHVCFELERKHHLMVSRNINSAPDF